MGGGGAPAPGAPMVPTPMLMCLCMHACMSIYVFFTTTVNVSGEKYGSSFTSFCKFYCDR